MTDIDSEKAALRQASLAKRRSLSEDKKQSLDDSVFRQLLSLDLLNRAEKIFMYASTPFEVSTDKTTEYCLNHEKTVCFPICLPQHQMAFMPVSGLSDLISGTYGIPEPRFDADSVIVPSEFDLCIVPALAVDKSGFRLGYGGGYYDRWLAQNKVKKAVLCYEFNLVDKVPVGEYDIAADFVITEQQCIPSQPDCSDGKEVY